LEGGNGFFNFTRNFCGGWNDPFYFHENDENSRNKKNSVPKFFLYFYGIVLMFDGAFNLIEKGAFYWSFTILFLVGLIIIILNLLGKIETKGN